MSFAACDYVDFPYDDNFGAGSTVALTTIDPADATADRVDKVVLLEDFTGFKCVNCPDAHLVSEDIHDEYGDQVAIVSVHASSAFAAPTPGAVFPDNYWQDFRTEDGEEYLSAFGIGALPSGIINREKFDGFYPIAFENWQAIIAGEVGQDAIVRIESTEAAVIANDTVSLGMSFEFLEDAEGEYYFTVALIENEVVSAQSNGGVTIEDYVQKDVFRGTLNGTFGELLIENPQQYDLGLVAGQYVIPNHFTDGAPNDEIDLSNCHILVYLYHSDPDNDGLEVMQVKHIDVVQ